MGSVRVAALEEIEIGKNRAYDLDGRSVLIARTSQGVFAVENRCSHAQQALEGGKMKASYIFCPLHGVRFDLRDGCPAGSLTDKPIGTWPVELKDGEIFVKIDPI